MEPLIGPPARLVRVQVDDEYGTVAEILDLAVLDTLTPRQRERLDELAGTLVDGLAGLLGSQAGAREAAIGQLTRLAADEAAYERVSERKGLLPL
jgi:hypothetical protein